VAPRNRLLLAMAAAVPLALAAGCANSQGGAAVGPVAVAASQASVPTTPGPGQETISETGSTLLYPLFRTWASAYHSQHSQVKITTAATGSGAGIDEASAGTADIGGTDAYLSSGDMVQNPRLENIPLAISAQQVYYHLPGSGARNLKLNGQVLALMYEGKITHWNDPRIARLNGGARLPAVRVVPLHRSDSSGDTFLFSSYLSTADATWSSAYGYGTSVRWPAIPGIAQPLGRKGNPGMVSACHAITGCLAYVGLSYAQQAQGLGEAQLRNTAGNYELPSAASIGAAVARFVSSTPPNETISMVNGPAPTGYPIVNYEYVIVRTSQPSAAKARDLKAFLHWVITAGQSGTYLNNFGSGPLPPSIPGFQPLPPSVVSLSDAQIAKIG
jgi:phosphate transport system substrate-binding protein